MKIEGTGIETETMKREIQKKEKEWSTENDSSNTVAAKDIDIAAVSMMIAHVLAYTWLVVFGFVCAWWVLAAPAFNRHSAVRRRRRAGERAVAGDVGVFGAAAALCVVLGVLAGKVGVCVFSCYAGL